jgi:hypothetical protein
MAGIDERRAKDAAVINGTLSMTRETLVWERK